MDPALISAFRRDGWVVIPGAVDEAVISEARRALGGIYPAYDQLERSPGEYPWATNGQFGGLRLWPAGVLLLDLLPLDDAVVSIAEALVDSDDLRLLRAGYQAKYGSTVDYNQVLHVDYPNHSLVVPADDDIVGFFLYLSDVTADLGPTMLVSDAVRGPLRPDRTHLISAPEHTGMYAAERTATGSAGSLLAYRSTTYHRGSAIIARRGVRLTLGFAYGRPAPWTGFQAFPGLAKNPGCGKRSWRRHRASVPSWASRRPVTPTGTRARSPPSHGAIRVSTGRLRLIPADSADRRPYDQAMNSPPGPGRNGPAARRGGRGGLVAVVIVAMLIVGGGAFGLVWSLTGNKAAAGGAGQATSPASPRR
jgi:hypothetical protein